MHKRTWVMIGALLASAAACAQDGQGQRESGRLTLPDLHALEAEARESTVVTVGPWLLHFASHFADERDPDSAATKRVLASIRSITIHSYEFDRDFVYSQSDLDAVRAQLRAPDWNRLAQVRSRSRDNVDVYVSMENDRTTGIAVIACDPRELTIINVVGSISPGDLHRLGMHLDMPGMKSLGSAAADAGAAQGPPAT